MEPIQKQMKKYREDPVVQSYMRKISKLHAEAEVYKDPLGFHHRDPDSNVAIHEVEVEMEDYVKRTYPLLNEAKVNCNPIDFNYFQLHGQLVIKS